MTTGNPGCGKTVLASSIIDKFSQQQTRSSCPVYYHFFQYHSSTNSKAVSAYRSILAQLLFARREDKELLDRFAFIMEDKSKGLSILPDLEAIAIFVDLIQLCVDPDSVFVFDGIDECVDNEAFLTNVLKIAKPHQLKIIMLSRINVPGLIRSVPATYRLSLSATVEKLSADIRQSCRAQLNSLFDEGILPQSQVDRTDELLEHLVCGADGMFLWAKLMITFLRSPTMTPVQRLQLITDIVLPEGLEMMYNRIMLHIMSSSASRNLAFKTLTWICHAIIPLSSMQLRQALIVEECLPIQIQKENVKEFETAVLMACAGLVECYNPLPLSALLTNTPSPPLTGAPFRLIHLSVKEMLQAYTMKSLKKEEGQSLMGHNWVPDRAMANLDLSKCCLRQLLYHSPAQPLSNNCRANMSAESLDPNLCLTNYAVAHWLSHLGIATEESTHFVTAAAGPIRLGAIMEESKQKQSNQNKWNYSFESKGKVLAENNWSYAFESSLSDFQSSLAIFLAEPRTLSAWLERFYTSLQHLRKPVSPQHDILARWATWAEHAWMGRAKSDDSRTLFRNALEFDSELKRVIQMWGENLRKSPESVWDEMTGFVGQRFFFHSGSTKVSYQTPSLPSSSGPYQERMAITSQTSSKGDIKGVLTIWSPV